MIFTHLKGWALLCTVAWAKTQIHDETFVPDAVLRVTEATITQSCMPPKLVTLINGTSPGPEIRLVEGSTYWIRVFNDLTHGNLTMHWHGLAMAASPFSDGSPSASQWPIPPAHFFDYEISPETGSAGTYFYHSHVGFQAVSATGPLIIEDLEEPPYHYDEERIIFLQDVFVKDDSTIESGLTQAPLIWSGETNMILLNGKGGGSNNGTSCNASLATINVEPGKTYRFRFIGGTALTLATFAIDGHDELTVIEADGSYTRNQTTSFMQIGSGQRFSVLLKTKPAPEKPQYYIQIETRDRPTLTRSFAVLNYGAKPSTNLYPPPLSQLSLPNKTYNFLEYTLTPLSDSDREAFPSAEEVTRRVTIRVHQHVDGRTIWLENGLPWTEDTPKEPYLVSLYKNNTIQFPSMQRALENNGIDPITSAFPAQIGEVLEIIIQNTGADSGGIDIHPWHAHGGHYYDIGSGNGTYDWMANEEKLKGFVPAKRDTTMLYRYGTSTGVEADAGWRAWRLRVEVAGVWMIHCHILQHMVMGMQTVWVMGDEEDILGDLGYPDVEGYLVYGGSVNGNESHWPEVVQFNTLWADGQ